MAIKGIKNMFDKPSNIVNLASALNLHLILHRASLNSKPISSRCPAVSAMMTRIPSEFHEGVDLRVHVAA